MTPDFRARLTETAGALGVSPVDLATVISYETAGTFDPAKRGPTTQWGQHRGLIQFGEPQAKQYGVDWERPLESQLGADGAIVRYLRDRGFKHGMSMVDLYSTINAGAPGLYNRSDANNGGAPGTVADKVRDQFGPHRRRAEAMLAAGGDTMTDASNDPMREAARAELARRRGQGGEPQSNPMREAARAELARRKAAGESSAPQTAPKQGRAAGLLDSVTQGLTMGFGDEISAAESALLGRKPGGGTFDLGNYDQPFSERYNAALSAERGQQAQFSHDNPVLDTVGEIGGAVAGAVVTPAARLVGAAGTALGRTGTAAAVGGATGAVYGFGDGEGGVIPRLESAAGGATMGAVGGAVADRAMAGASRLFSAIGGSRLAVIANGQLTAQGREILQRAGVDADNLPENFLRSWEQRIKQASGATDETVRMAQADEFGIPLTRGQATGNEASIAFEEAARNNARGAPAAAVVQGIDEKARAATNQTTNTTAQAMGGAAPDALAAAQRVTRAFQEARATAKAGVDAAYNNPAISGARVGAAAFADLPDLIAAKLDEVTFTPSGPAIAAVRDIQTIVEKAATEPGGVSFEMVERLRQKINRISRAAEPAVGVELGAIRGALDEWTETAVDQALISGDTAALAAVKAARNKYREFAQLFGGRKPGGDVDRILERLGKADVTPQEAADWLFGASRVGETGLSVRLANRMKKILPDGAWGELRAGAWRRLTESSADEGTKRGPQWLSTRIRDFTTGEGRELARILYTPQEIAMIARFGKAMDVLTAPASATNSSKTAYAMSRMMGDMGQAMAATLGLASGGPVGGLGALLAGAALKSGTSTVKAVGVPATRATVARGAAQSRGATVIGGATATRDSTETERRGQPR